MYRYAYYSIGNKEMCTKTAVHTHTLALPASLTISTVLCSTSVLIFCQVFWFLSVSPSSLKPPVATTLDKPLPPADICFQNKGPNNFKIQITKCFHSISLLATAIVIAKFNTISTSSTCGSVTIFEPEMAHTCEKQNYCKNRKTN